MGYRWGRRREEVVLICTTLGEKLLRQGISSTVQFFDVKNAFASVDRKNIFEHIENDAVTFECKEFLKKRVQVSVVTVMSCYGEVHLRPRSGNGQGDSIAGKQFLNVYEPGIIDFRDQIPEQGHVFATSPASGVLIDCTVVTYADDVARRTLILDKHCDIAEALHQNSRALSTALWKLGLVQHEKKQDILLKLMGAGSRLRSKHVRRSLVMGEAKIKPHARYLGTRVHTDGYWYPEVSMRKAAAMKGWRITRKFLVSGSPQKVRRVVFASMV